MQDSVFALAILLLGLVIVNKLMAIPQIKRLNKQLKDIKKLGPVSSVGLSRHWTGNRAFVLITDIDGNILHEFYTSGNTVFSGFKEDLEYSERNYTEILDSLSDKKKLSKKEAAKKMAAEYLARGFEDKGGPCIAADGDHVE